MGRNVLEFSICISGGEEKACGTPSQSSVEQKQAGDEQPRYFNISILWDNRLEHTDQMRQNNQSLQHVVPSQPVFSLPGGHTLFITEYRVVFLNITVAWDESCYYSGMALFAELCIASSLAGFMTASVVDGTWSSHLATYIKVGAPESQNPKSFQHTEVIRFYIGTKFYLLKCHERFPQPSFGETAHFGTQGDTK
jgi:hypothetical protein